VIINPPAWASDPELGPLACDLWYGTTRADRDYQWARGQWILSLALARVVPDSRPDHERIADAAT
jgi:hypothetical protein